MCYVNYILSVLIMRPLGGLQLYTYIEFYEYIYKEGDRQIDGERERERERENV